MEGYKYLEKTKPLFEIAMAQCPKSQAEFERIDLEYQRILSRPDAEEVQRQNYRQNKTQIDADTAKAISEWNKPNPTSAGRAAGEIMRLING